MATHSSTLAWKIPWMEEPGRLQSMGSLRVRHDWVTSLSLSIFMHWRRKWHPIPVFLPGESHGRRRLIGCSPWGRTESDMSETTWQNCKLGTIVDAGYAEKTKQPPILPSWSWRYNPRDRRQASVAGPERAREKAEGEKVRKIMGHRWLRSPKGFGLQASGKSLINCEQRSDMIQLKF